MHRRSGRCMPSGACKDIVCALDSFCCGGAWDSYCAACANGEVVFGTDCSEAVAACSENIATCTCAEGFGAITVKKKSSILVNPIPVKTEVNVPRPRIHAPTRQAIHALQEHAKTLFVHSIRSAAMARGTSTVLHAPMAKLCSVRIAARL